jgi:uncharacterized protein
MEFALNGRAGCNPPHATFRIPTCFASTTPEFMPATFRGRFLRRGFAVFVKTPYRRIPMFEHRQEEMERLMKENEEFLRIYNRHQELDKRVTAAEFGTAPMEDLALIKLKKEKLWAKDRLARIMDSAGAGS